ncbi:MAG: hypothetical protein ABII13_00895 [Patescibacteria group bacterium]|nr:hypothetical protein [Patescibacteria group bacterium]MBU2509254.1 hypothetical protein [Patescibacteria group bacterium]
MESDADNAPPVTKPGGSERKNEDASQYLDRKLPSLRQLSDARGVPRENLRRRLEKSMGALLKQSSFQPAPKDVPLVAIADAFYETILDNQYVIYLILLKPIGSTKAVICPPLIRKGDSENEWKLAFGLLSEDIKERICALVSDGCNDLRGVALERGWHIQRCQFHLLMRIRNYISATSLSRQKHISFLIHTSIKTNLAYSLL